MKPKICWAETFTRDSTANVLGYVTHNNFMKKYSEDVLEFDTSADVALCITIADHFQRIPNKINALFSMWEFNDLPMRFVAGLNRADYLIVPSSFCRDLFRRYTNKPIYVCWEGIEAEKYPFYQRRFPAHEKGEKFRFLWVGAPNPRKGYLSILEVIKLVEKVPEWELYVKTTAPKKTPWQAYPKVLQRRISRFLQERNKRSWQELCESVKRFTMPSIDNKLTVYGKYKNIIVDTRKLPFDELVGLYNSAHCFLLPTLGEGWGLTLCEAMATGCPSIATNVTGVKEFFGPDYGYEIKYDVKEVKQGEFRDYPELQTTGYFPDTKNLVEQMIHVYQNYPEALSKGKKASRRVHDKFTWRLSALRLRDIIQDIYQQERIKKDKRAHTEHVSQETINDDILAAA
jgi:glycosyltransferase involved in cell wall biosynthesis